jgi:hypothetical protein
MNTKTIAIALVVGIFAPVPAFAQGADAPAPTEVDAGIVPETLDASPPVTTDAAPADAGRTAPLAIVEPAAIGNSVDGFAATPTPTPSEKEPSYERGLLRPVFPEERYPGDKPPGQVEPSGVRLSDTYRFDFHGYFRAPLRMAWVRRPEGTAKANEGNYNYRSPFLIDDDYFRSGFAYTRLAETDFTELYLMVGNERVSGAISLQGSLFSGSARPLIDRQLGIAQGWVSYRFRPEFGQTKGYVELKAGSFWDRYGWLPYYDTYIFGRTHQMGARARFELETKGATLFYTHGVGTHLEAIESNQGLTLAQTISVGASFRKIVELGLYFLESDMREKRQLKDLTDANMRVVGTDLRVDSKYAGRLYAGLSRVTVERGEYLAPVLEVMHSYGGRGLEENFFGTEKSDHGTGSLTNFAFQYDVSLAQVLSKAKGRPIHVLPWNGDISAALFGLYTAVGSKQVDPNPALNRDGRKQFKWGAELSYRVNAYVGASVRYDRVVLDVDDSANSFRVVSPRLAFFPHFLPPGNVLGAEQIFIQYSRYMYNERVRLRPGQVQLETLPDDNVVKVQAQMSF